MGSIRDNAPVTVFAARLRREIVWREAVEPGRLLRYNMSSSRSPVCRDEMIAIPEELLEQIDRGYVLLFVRDRIARDASGRLLKRRLVEEMFAHCDIEGAEAYTFPEAAQAYEDLKGRQARSALEIRRWNQDE